MSIIIRKATLNDAQAMHDLNLKEMPENYPIEVWTQLLGEKNDCSYVAYAGTDLAGYVLSMVTHSMLYFREEGHIASITTASSHRKRGVGKALMESALKCMKESRKVTTCKLNVRVDNYVAQYMYRKLGFKIVRTDKAYYSDGTDAYVMHCDF